MSDVGVSGTPWSAQEQQAAILMWREGKSGSAIGRTLGRTRSAVFGKLWRLELRGVRATARPTAKRGSVHAGKVLAARLRREKPPQRPPDGPGFVGKTWNELGRLDCRWIEGEPGAALFCAAPAAPGSSYCGHHHARCYQAGTAGATRMAANVARAAAFRDAGPRYVAGWAE